MFTGLVEHVSKITSLSGNSKYRRLLISSPPFYNEIRKGDSIAVNGICLTAEEIRSEYIQFSIMTDTVKKTSAVFFKPGQFVNLERAVKADGRLDGHIVSGHVDCAVRILRLQKNSKENSLFFRIHDKFRDFLFTGCSIAVDGISLTVQDYKFPTVKVSLIPETIEKTNLFYKKTGEYINLEFDIILKKYQRNSGITMKKLESVIGGLYV